MQMVLAPEMAIVPKKKMNKGTLRRIANTSNLLTYTDTPAARQVVVKNRPPVVRTGNNATRITGHEQIATVNGSIGFTSTKYQVNPGLGFYTWLSSRAVGWEKYKLIKFEVMYVPAEANTTTPGSVYLVADYDPTDPPPSSLQALSTYESQVNGRVYNALTLSLSTKRMFDGVQTKYVREGPVASALSLYDAASYTFATISCSDSAPIGQLWVSYVVDLISPQTESALPISPSYSFFTKPELQDQRLTWATLETITFPDVVVNGSGIAYADGVFTLPKANWHITGQVNLHSYTTSPSRVIPTVDGQGLNAIETQFNGGVSYFLAVPVIAYVSSNGKTQFRVDCFAGAGVDPGNQDWTDVIASGTVLAFRVV